MKAKKMIALLLTLCLGLFVFAGCTPEMEAYNLENEKLMAWPGCDMAGTGSMEMTAEGQTFPVSFAYTGVTQTLDDENALMQMNMTFDPITVEDQTLQFPDMEMYIDSTEMAVVVNTDYFRDYFKLYGIENNPFADVTTEFIQLDLSAMSADPAGMLGFSTAGWQYMNSPAFVKDAEALAEAMFKDVEPPFDVTQDGRSFTTEFTIDRLVDSTVAGLDEIITNWETISPQLIDMTTKMGMPVTQDQLDELKAQYDAAAVEEYAAQAKTALAGTEFSMVETFTDTTYESEFDMNLNVASDDYPMTMVMAMEIEQVRNDEATVTMPTDITVITFEELMAAFVNPTGTIHVIFNGQPIVFDQEPLIINDRVMVPFRAIGEAAGATVEWDEATQTVTMNDVVLTIGSNQAMVGENAVELDSPATIVGDRTLVPLRFVSENFGYQVEWFETPRVVTIQTAA